MGVIEPNPDDSTTTGARRRTGFVGNPRRANRDDALTEQQYNQLWCVARRHGESLITVCAQEFDCGPGDLSKAAATALLAWYEKETSK